MQPVVSTDWLAGQLDNPRIVPVDVRWKHNDPDHGCDAFRKARIPRAVRLDLDDDLSDRSDPDLRRGRHPLPDAKRFAETLAQSGIGRDSIVIAYDDAAGSIAARLWFMLRWIGHTDGAVLDGGIDKWLAEDRPVESGPFALPTIHCHAITPRPDASMLLTTKDEVAAALSDGVILLDARSLERFRGEFEPIDKHAGSIAGATNAPFTDNLTGDIVASGNVADDKIKTLRPAAELRQHFADLGINEKTPVACYCGSGVSACHNLLAFAVAGLPIPKLYPGSWSEWSL